VVGCGTCVTVCFAGGAREAAILAASLRMATKLDGNGKAGHDVTVSASASGNTWTRLPSRSRRRPGALAGLRDRRAGHRRALPQGLGRARPEHHFLGLPTEQGVWAERCAACGDCILGLPAASARSPAAPNRCSTGPAAARRTGTARSTPTYPCAWQLIYDRLSSMGKAGPADGNPAAQKLAHVSRRRPAQNRAGRP
jgi:ferredoxin